MQDKVKVKSEYFKEWFLCRNAKNWEKYETARKEIKKGSEQNEN